jgi:hypothetical protein
VACPFLLAPLFYHHVHAFVAPYPNARLHHSIEGGQIVCVRLFDMCLITLKCDPVVVVIGWGRNMEWKYEHV